LSWLQRRLRLRKRLRTLLRLSQPPPLRSRALAFPNRHQKILQILRKLPPPRRCLPQPPKHASTAPPQPSQQRPPRSRLLLS